MYYFYRKIKYYKSSNILKTKQLLKNCVFVNGNKKDYNIPKIEMDEKTNDFYFIFNLISSKINNIFKKY